MYRLKSIERAPLSEPLDNALPTEAVNKGYGLSWFNPEWYQTEPVILFKHNWEVYQWDYTPSIAEVWDKIRELEAKDAPGNSG